MVVVVAAEGGVVDLVVVVAVVAAEGGVVLMGAVVWRSGLAIIV